MRRCLGLVQHQAHLFASTIRPRHDGRLLSSIYQTPSSSCSVFGRPIAGSTVQVPHRTIHSKSPPSSQYSGGIRFNRPGGQYIPEYLGNDVPTPYGDDARSFKHLISDEGTPYTFQDAGELFVHHHIYCSQTSTYIGALILIVLSGRRAVQRCYNTRASKDHGSQCQNFRHRFRRLSRRENARCHESLRAL